MIASIIGMGSFLDASGKPIPRLVVRLEMLTIKDGWRTIAQSQTTEKGEVRMKGVSEELREFTVVPTTRLVDEKGNPLAENPLVNVHRNELTLNFGETAQQPKISVLGTRGIIPTIATGKLNKDVVLPTKAEAVSSSDEKLLQSVKIENAALLQRANVAALETKSLKAENDMLLQRLSQVDQQSRNLKLEQETLRKQATLTTQDSNVLKNENKLLLQRANEAEQQRQNLKVENVSLAQSVGDANKITKALQLNNETLQQEMNLAKQKSETLKKTELELKGRVTEQESKINLLNSQLENLKKPIANDVLDKAATTEFSRLKLETLGTKIELQESAAQTKILTNNLKGLTQERDQLALELNELRAAETAAPRIDTLASTIAQSLQGIENQGVELVDARISIKGYLAGGGNQFKPLDAAELSRINPGLASEISFGVRPKPAANAENGSKMPDVVGLTPASASRILRPLGNKIEIIAITGIPVGAIISQIPKAGGPLPLDAPIRLMVATE